MEECTKPNCDCIEQEIRKKGTEFIKSYPCLKGGSADQEKASRPKEVEQPVQQEGPSVQKYHFGEWVIVNGDPTDERQVVDYDVLNNSYNLDKEGMWNWFDASRVSKVQPSTPIVEEQSQMPFESYPELTDYIQEMACTGKAPRSWTAFIECLNNSLSPNREEGRELQATLSLIISQSVNDFPTVEYQGVSGKVTGIKRSGNYRGCSVRFDGKNYDDWFWDSPQTDRRSKYVRDLKLCVSPSSTPLEQKELNGWISVKDKLPEPNVRVRAIRTFGNGRMEETHTVYIERTECFDDFHTDIITHWQPIVLPLPLTEGV